MPTTIAKFKCNKCGDIFVTNSDLGFTKCKCGACNLEPHEYFISYFNTDGAGKNFTQLESNTYYSHDEIYTMSGDVLSLFNQVKSLCKELDFYYFDSYVKDKNGNDLLYNCNFDKDECANDVEFNSIEFHKEFSNDVDQETEEQFKNRLTNFKDLLEHIKNNNLALSDRKQLLDKDYLSWDRKQKEYYDYKFYFE